DQPQPSVAGSCGEPPPAKLVELHHDQPQPSVAGLSGEPLRGDLVELHREVKLDREVELHRERLSGAGVAGQPGPQPHAPGSLTASQRQPERRAELLARVDETEAGAVVRYRLLR